MKKQPISLTAFFWHHIKPFKWFIIMLLSTAVFWGIHNSVTPYFLKVMIDTIANYSNDKANVFAVMKFPALIYMSLWFLMVANFRIRDWIILKIFPAIRGNIINEMSAYLNRHSYEFMQNNFAGSLANKIMEMSGSTVAVLLRIEESFATFMAFLIAIISMYFIHPIFSVIMLGWAIVFISITSLFTKKTKELSHIFAESRASLSGKIVDVTTNLANTMLFARCGYEHNRLMHAVKYTITKDRSLQWYLLKMRLCWDVTFITLIGGMLATLIILYSKSLIVAGDFAFIMTVSINIFMYSWELASKLVEIAEEVGKCSQALSIMNTPHEITDSENAKQLNVTDGKIVLQDVTFKYKRGKNVFEKQNLVIPAGQKIGLVGFSGSGKTTFVNLLLRLFDIDSGKITIDGQNIREITQDSLRENIALIPQDISLFHRTLMENVRYGKIDASDDEVMAAAQHAHCHQFIEQLPDGYDTLVGERGIKLSGGQRQRIAIARAILKDAPILILDEATSALDSVTETQIQESLHRLMEGRTSIIIAHRLSTLLQMDRIIVFDQGHIIEDGTHESLLQQGGQYAKMWEKQAGGFLPEKE
jgi:ATP-binding cassette subfamily B protein